MGRANIFIVGAVVAGMIAPVGPADAQPAEDKALAEQLFAQGRALAKRRRWAEACPKFEASLRYDDALGARLNLANCYKHLGTLATAWGLYRDSADRARRAGDARRRDYALEEAAALAPRLPSLTIAMSAVPPAGFSITRDGLALDPAVLGTAMYVDPGPHEVTATAPGFEPFKARIVVAEAMTESVVIPELVPPKQPAGEPRPELDPAAEPRPQARLPSGTPIVPPTRPEPSDSPPRRKYIALGTAATGAVMTGIGLYFGARASLKYDQARDACGDLICENDADFEKGRDLISQTRTNATLSTIFVATGIAAVGTGVALWLTAPRRSRVETVRLVLVITDSDVGVALSGRL
jgi:tetratricopeptide (TPR) repeat protein